MPQRSHHFLGVRTAVLGVLCSLMILVVMPPPARAAPSVTTHTVIITQQGTVFILNPCATKPDGTPFLLQPGDLLAFENHTSGAVQILLGDLSDTPPQVIPVPAHGTASLVPQVRNFFSYSLAGKACFGRVLAATLIHTVLITPGTPAPHVTPCFASPDSFVLVPGDTLQFQNQLAATTSVIFTDTTNDVEQRFDVPGGNGTVRLVPPPNIIFTYSVPSGHDTCSGRVLAETPSTLPPTGGGPIPAASAQTPWLLAGSALAILGLLGLSGTLVARRRGFLPIGRHCDT